MPQRHGVSSSSFDLNELGAQGWETVGTLSPTYGQGQSLDVTMVLKRGIG